MWCALVRNSLSLHSQCGSEFTMEQVIPLNVSEEEEKAMREAMEEKRKQAKIAKVQTNIPISTCLYKLNFDKFVT